MLSSEGGAADMQTKDITKLLNIPRERIKYYKKKQVFAPELEAERGKTGEFTERDLSLIHI